VSYAADSVWALSYFSLKDDAPPHDGEARSRTQRIAEPDHAPPADIALLHRIRASERAALDELYLTHANALLMFAERFVPPDTAEDIVHDVFLSVWQRRETLTVRGDLRGYLFGAVRQSLWHLRRHERVVDATDDTVYEATFGAPPVAPDVAMSITELEETVAALLAQLSERQRAMVQLRWGEGLTFDAIAHIMGTSVSAAKMAVGRAQQQLRPLLRQFVDE
jgi:RNA polymerase sigma factor (sigma-70 family)